MVAVSRRRPLLALVAVFVAAAVMAVPAVSGADEIADKRAKAAAIAAKISELSHEVERYAEAANGAQYELDQLSTQIAESETKVATAQAEVSLRKEQLKGYAIDAYVNGDRATLEEAVLADASSTNDFGQRKGYLNAAADSRQQLIDQLRATQQNLNDQIGQLNASKGAAEARKNDLAQARSRAQAAVTQQQQLKSQTDAEIAALVAEAEAAEAAAQAQRAQQRAQQEQARQAAPPPPPPSRGGGGGGGGGGTSPAPAPKPSPAPPPPAPGPAPAPSGGAAAAVAEGLRQVGKPYVWGGSGPDSFDCSGFTAWAWRAGGVSLPHFTDAQYAQTTHISLSQLQPGDLVYHNGSGGSWQHVGLYIGGGQMVHAPGAGRYVRVDSIYYWDTTMAASRP